MFMPPGIPAPTLQCLASSLWRSALTKARTTP